MKVLGVRENVSDDEASLTSYSSVSNPFPEGTFGSGDGDRARYMVPLPFDEDSEDDTRSYSSFV